MILSYILWFTVVWFSSFLFHEAMHCFEHRRQGGQYSTVEFWQWHGLPSLRVIHHGVQRNPDMVRLAGGLYTGIVLWSIEGVYLAIVSVLGETTVNAITYSLLCIGWVQVLYGIYECCMLDRLSIEKYMFWHYCLYCLVIVVFSVIWVIVK